MIESNYYIASTCIVERNEILVNDQLVYANEGVDFASFAKGAFKNLAVDYPKFYKMDSLSKLAFLAADYILKEVEYKEDVALFFSNRSGSLDTDIKHQDSIKDKENFFPSPAIFVYTLANICIGELSIRHGLQSENAFFVSDAYDIETMFAYTQYTMASGKADKILCGWVEIFEENYKAVLYLVDKSGDKLHSQQNISQLFIK